MVEKSPVRKPWLLERGVVALADGAAPVPAGSVELGPLYVVGAVPSGLVVEKSPVRRPWLLERGVVEFADGKGEPLTTGAVPKAAVELPEGAGMLSLGRGTDVTTVVVVE